MKPAAQINAEAFVRMLVEKKQPLNGFSFTEYTSPTTGLRWFIVERGRMGSATHPNFSHSHISPEGETLDGFRHAVEAAVRARTEASRQSVSVSPCLRG